MRFFKKSKVNRQNISTRKCLFKPEIVFQKSDHLMQFKALKSYDDEQKLLLLALHYNANLQQNLMKLEKPMNLVIPQKQLNQQAEQTLFYLGNSVLLLNLSSNWFSYKQRFGKLSGQNMIFETMSLLENVNDITFNNNVIRGQNGPVQFYQSIGKCGQNLQFLRIKSCTYGET